MRHTFDIGLLTATADAKPFDASLSHPATGDGQTGDAVAAACICGILGGLIAGLLIATIPVVAVGAFIGAGVGIVLAYE